MGMMDQKRYLTGTNGAFSAGDIFRLHGVKISGQVRKPGSGTEVIPEVALLVSLGGTDDQFVVYTTGAAIVGQVQRVDAQDRNRMTQPGGWEVRLAQLPPTRPQESGAFTLQDAAQHPAEEEANLVRHESTPVPPSPDPTPGAPQDGDDIPF